MNIDTYKIGRYTITSYSGRSHTLYNDVTGEVYNILPSEYKWLKDNMSLETCNVINDVYERSAARA